MIYLILKLKLKDEKASNANETAEKPTGRGSSKSSSTCLLGKAFVSWNKNTPRSKEPTMLLPVFAGIEEIETSYRVMESRNRKNKCLEKEGRSGKSWKWPNVISMMIPWLSWSYHLFGSNNFIWEKRDFREFEFGHTAFLRLADLLQQAYQKARKDSVTWQR